MRSQQCCNRLLVHVYNTKGTPLRSACDTPKKYFFENLFFLLSTCVGHNSLSCGTLICLLSVGNSFKTCIITVDLYKALQCFSLFNRYIPILNRFAKSIEEILRYHKISFDRIYTKYLGNKQI